jgi:hypothetical protein
LVERIARSATVSLAPMWLSAKADDPYSETSEVLLRRLWNI